MQSVGMMGEAEGREEGRSGIGSLAEIRSADQVHDGWMEAPDWDAARLDFVK